MSYIFLTLRAVGFSYASRERNHCEQPFDFPSSMCEVRHTPRDVFDVNSSYFAGNHYTAASSKRSSYVAERTRKAPKHSYFIQEKRQPTRSYSEFDLLGDSLQKDLGDNSLQRHKICIQKQAGHNRLFWLQFNISQSKIRN